MPSQTNNKPDPIIGHAEAQERSGATYRQLDYWIRQGYLRGIGMEGSGTIRDYPDAEVEIAAIIVRLLAAGLVLPVAAAVARTVIETGDSNVPLGDAGIWIEVSR
jgi:hypothetical protein